MSNFCQRLYHRKCQHRGVHRWSKKHTNLVNVVCEWHLTRNNPLNIGLIKNGNPLNFSTIRNKKIKKPQFFQKLLKFWQNKKGQIFDWAVPKRGPSYFARAFLTGPNRNLLPLTESVAIILIIPLEIRKFVMEACLQPPPARKSGENQYSFSFCTLVCTEAAIFL